MIRLCGRKRLAVLLAALVAALSLACARGAAEPTSTGVPNTGAAGTPAAGTAPSTVSPAGVPTVDLDEIKEQAVRDLFDDKGRMVTPDQRLARIAAFRAAYRGNRQVDRILPVPGDYAFNDLLEWFHPLDAAMVKNGILLSTGSVLESSNRIRFGLEDIGQAGDARRIMSDLDIPQGAVVFEQEQIELLAN